MEALQDLWLTYQSAVNFIGVNGLLALSVYATLSCGQLSLANAGFMAMGGYTAALLTVHVPSVPFPLVLAASSIVPSLVAVPLGFVNWDFTNGALGLVGIPQRAGLVSIFGCLALALFLFWRIRGSKTG